MNRGLIIRAFRELWQTTLLLGLVLMGVEAALAFVLPKFGAQMTQEWLQMDFARGIMQAMLGSEIGDRMGPQMFQSMAWVHPVVLALAWAHALLCCTRVPPAKLTAERPMSSSACPCRVGKCSCPRRWCGWSAAQPCSLRRCWETSLADWRFRRVSGLNSRVCCSCCSICFACMAPWVVSRGWFPLSATGAAGR